METEGSCLGKEDQREAGRRQDGRCAGYEEGSICALGNVIMKPIVL